MASTTGLTKAVKAFDLGALHAGLDESPDLIGHRDERGRSGLHLVCSVDGSAAGLDLLLMRQTDLAFVRLLVDHGARGNIADRAGVTASELLGRRRDPALRAIGDELAES